MFDIIVRNKDGKSLDKVRCMSTQCTIGKGRDNLVVMKGWRVEPVHAELTQNDDGIFIESRAATGGMLINEDKVETYGPLRSRDVITIGNYRLSVGKIVDKSAGSGGNNGIEADVQADARAGKEAAPVAQAEPEGRESADQMDDEEPPDPMMSTMIGVRPLADIEDDEDQGREARFRWRNLIHRKILEKMDLRRVDVGSMEEDELREQVKKLIDESINEMSAELPASVDRSELAQEVLDEAVGLGPLEELLANEEITEVMVNRFDDIYTEENGRLKKSDVTFSSDSAVFSAIERIVAPLGRRIDESSPMVDARLKDGSRVNAIIPPLALRGPTITIRKFSTKKLTADDLVAYGAVDRKMCQFLEMAVNQRCNIVISGGTGSGKTTLLNVLSNYIPHGERVITLEDAAELKLNMPHLVSLESRPPNIEGKGAIPIRDLLKNTLRMRPDRIVVGECRGGEALDMLQAMNTGHDGSLTTAHANSPRDVLARLEVMVMMSGMELPIRAIREQVASAVDLVVQQSRFSDGSRRITHVTEITGVEGDMIQMQDIFRFRREGFDSDGRIQGRFEATGQVPQFYEGLREQGVAVDMSLFA